MFDQWPGPHRAEGTPDTHLCPGPRCGGQREIPWHMLMCNRDWYALPKPIRTAVWRTWQDGRGAGTPEHTRAMRLAVVIAQRLVAAQRLAGHA